MMKGVKSWVLEKYTRLYDPRNAPMSVEKGKSDDLSIYIDCDSGRVYLMHNGRLIEDFLVRSSYYPHEVVCKDSRVLFVIRNQSDGCCVGKFRVRFTSLVLCAEFCEIVETFNKVDTYSVWHKTDESSLMNSTVRTDDAEVDRKPEKKVPLSDVREEDHHQQQQPIVINLQIDTLISDAAMNRFCGMVESVVCRLTGTKKPRPRKVKKPSKSVVCVPKTPKKPIGRRATCYNLRGSVKEETPSELMSEVDSNVEGKLM